MLNALKMPNCGPWIIIWFIDAYKLDTVYTTTNLGKIFWDCIRLVFQTLTEFPCLSDSISLGAKLKVLISYR